MPRRRRQPPDTNPPAPAKPAPPPPPAYDWSRFGRHRLRAPDGVIIDVPVPVGAGPSVWVATVWPDPQAPGGWGRALWQHDPTTGRGWRLPVQLAAGDVLEFGADNPQGPLRWYGIMDSYEVNQWATIQGPYPHPATAHDDAQRLLALERFLPALDPEPPPRNTATGTQPHRDRPRRHHRHP